jgi:hypothetical protein
MCNASNIGKKEKRINSRNVILYSRKIFKLIFYKYNVLMTTWFHLTQRRIH